MDNLNEVQPIDGYVSTLLEKISKQHNILIDLDNPTRAQRLEAALAIKDESSGFNSMEIMVGKRVGANEEFAQIFGRLRLAEAMRGNRDPRRFYEGFAHQYWPSELDKHNQ